MNVQAFVYAMWEPFVGFGIILFLLRRFASRNRAPTPLQRAQNDAAFGAYIVHPLLVAAASIPLCFAAAWLLRICSGASRIL